MRKRTKGVQGTATDMQGTRKVYAYGVLQQTQVVYSPRYNRDISICEDEVHPDYPKSGGPLSILHFSQKCEDADVRSGYETNPGKPYYAGDIHQGKRRAIMSQSLSYPEPAYEACRALGPEAWSRFQPKIARVSLGQFLAEIRDTPKLLRFQLKKFKDLGSGYLNYQFGWKPFLSDLRSWYQSLLKIDSQIAQLKNQNGKWTRRGGTIDTFSETNTSNASLHWDSYCSNIQGKTVTTHSIESWFSGSFRFYIPGLDDGKWGELKAIRQLWGLEVTPALVYELIPYSWLVDWFSNVGHVMKNYTAITNDNMAAKYAYVMRKEEIKTDTTVSFDSTFTTSINYQGSTVTNGHHTSKMSSESITKHRTVASPYGFEIDWPDFSQYQLSILAALGISRQRF